MLSVRKVLLPVGVVALIGLSSPTKAQGLPAIPAAGAAAAPTATAAEPGLGLLGRIAQRLDAFRRRLALTPVGQLLQNAKKPLSAATGGLLGNPLKPTDKDAAAPGAGGAAAAGKKDAAEAKKRREDVAYLGTLDCRYYPNASKALADALRTDPSECVRYEAAMALSRSCCCNGTTIKALTASVSGMDSDGNPSERSARVRCTAAIGLERCLACYVPPIVEPEPQPKPKPKGEDPKGEGDKTKAVEISPITKADDNEQTTRSNAPTAKQVRRARETLADFQSLMLVSATQIQSEIAPQERSVIHILQASFNSQASSQLVPTRVVPTVAVAPPAPQIQMPIASTRAAKLLPPKMEPEIAPVAAVAPKATPKFVPVPDDTAILKGISVRCLNAADAADQHRAIRELMRYDWNSQPLVAATLLYGARAGQFREEVRVDCLRMLAIGKVNHPQVIQGLTGLAEDPNDWVRKESSKALAELTASR